MSDMVSAAVALEGVESALAAARDGIDAVLRDRGLRRTSPQDTAAALLLAAASTATLEGDPVEPQALVEGDGGPTARAALRLSGELLSLVPVLRRSPIQLFARIHSLAAGGSAPDEALGRPTSAAGRDRLADLAAAMLTTPAPPLAIAAVAHAEIVVARAFPTHNAMIGRAVERLVLVERGTDPASVLVTEAAHAQASKAYVSALAAYEAGDALPWMLYSADVFTRAAELSPIVNR